jgi:twitching motility protein PilU
LQIIVEQDASDMILTANTKPYIKVNGQLRPAYAPVLTQGETAALALAMMTPEQRERFQEQRECNLALAVPDIGRFRVNIYYQRNEVSIAIRHVKSTVPSFEALGVPGQAGDFALLKRGLVLVTGMAGSGKSTTLAAMIEHRAKHATGHILTIEDPIEYILPHGRSLVEQREVGFDTHSFDDALRNVLREAVDVIVIGEIRDLETARQALAYADGGILCLATMHSNSADQAISRLLNFFPTEMREQALLDLSMNLKGVICQRLLPSLDHKLVLAAEVMIQSSYISELIVSSRLTEIKDAMHKSAEEGMLVFDDSLFKLYKAGKISLDEAMLNADSQADLSVRIRLSSWNAPLGLA